MLDVELLGVRRIYMRHPEDIRYVMQAGATNYRKSPGIQRLRKWLGQGLLLNQSDTDHAAMRDIIMPAFRPDAIRSYTHMFAQVADALADVLLQSEGSPVDVQPLCQRATLDVIGLAGFSYDFGALAWARGGRGDDNGRVDVIGLWADLMRPSLFLGLNLPVPDELVPGYAGYAAAVEQLDKVVADMLAEHRAGRVRGSRQSILTFMLEAQAAGNSRVSDQQIRDELMTFMLAGSDTTATTLAFCLWELSRRPDCLAQVLAEVDDAVGAKQGPVSAEDVQQRMPLLTGCINETLRCYSAAPGISRTAVQDDVIGGYAIPAGSVMLGSLWSMHRHEDFWPRPDEWLPQRWLPHNASALAPAVSSAFLPFSVGSRSCIGRYFAVLEAQVMLAQLLRRVAPGPAPGAHQLHLRQSITLEAANGAVLLPLARPPARSR